MCIEEQQTWGCIHRCYASGWLLPVHINKNGQAAEFQVCYLNLSNITKLILYYLSEQGIIFNIRCSNAASI